MDQQNPSTQVVFMYRLSYIKSIPEDLQHVPYEQVVFKGSLIVAKGEYAGIWS